MSGFSNGSKKQKTATLRNIVEMTRNMYVQGQTDQATGSTNNNEVTTLHEDNAVISTNGEVTPTKQGIMDKLSTNMSKKSRAVQQDEGVKFKLVEDIRLVTIPITTCLFVLLSYIIFGAILFASWEVKNK